MITLSYVPDYSELDDFYGHAEMEPSIPDPCFVQDNCERISLPFMMYLSWNVDRRIGRTAVAEQIAPALIDALKEIRDYKGSAYLRDHGMDLYGGCYNYRAIRGGKYLSTHSWACSFDINPHLGPYKGENKQPQFIIDAFIKRGFTTFPWDGMHFQAVQSKNLKAICDRDLIQKINETY